MNKVNHKMHTITFILLFISQYLNVSSSTRLPLEVYELTPAAAAAASSAVAASASSSQQQQQQQQTIDLKHKTLEYTTFNAKTLAAAKNPTTKTTMKTTTPIPQTPDISLISISAEQQNQELDTAIEGSGGSSAAHTNVMEHRRARQMLLSQRGMLHLQKQQQQQQQQHGKDVRILYQIGDSEQDLPICAPNAVCSKIDLYETPWIERQCRCPETNRIPNVIIHHHNHNHLHQSIQHHHDVSTSSSSVGATSSNNNNKFHNFYEKEKLLQHKRLLLGEFNEKKYESIHLKKLMQKLGAVYEDDLHLQASDYLEQDYNDALTGVGGTQDYAEINNNEFPYTHNNHYTAHMRHSGHRGSAKETITFIGGCSSNLGIEDGYTIADKTRHYKLCQPVHKLPVCKHFRDYTWTLTTSAELNVTEQIVHCRCPRNSVTYLTKREPAASGINGYTYLFACSPLTRIRCQRKQPCKLFTVRKRQELLDEVNINSLCQCPKGHHCPSHHTQSSVIAGETFLEDNIQTYSGYCMAND